MQNLNLRLSGLWILVALESDGSDIELVHNLSVH